MNNHRREKKIPTNQRKVETGPDSPGHFLQYKSRPGKRTTAKQRAIIRNRKRAALKRANQMTKNNTEENVTKKNEQKNVHTRHCCKQCGCKYGEDTAEEGPFDDEPFIACSVVSGRLKQESPCGKQYTCS